MIILLDSNFRNKQIYPFISDFAVPINTTPSDRFQDNRCFYSLNQNILFSFKYLKEIKDLDYQLINPLELLILYNFNIDSNLYIVFQNLITGFIIQNETTNKTSIIDACQFMPNGLYCILKYSVQFPINGKLKLINPTENTIQKEIINYLIYGYSNFNYSPTPGFLKDYGITDDCVLVNLTKNWKQRIKNYDETYRIVTIKNQIIEENDYFILLNPSNFNDHFESIEIFNQYVNGVYQFEIIEKTFINDIENEIFNNIQKNIEIKYIQNKYRIKIPGNHVQLLETIVLESLNDNQRKFTIKVLKQVPLIINVQSIPIYYNVKNNQYLFFFITIKEWIPFYSYVIDIDSLTHLIYLETPYCNLETIGYIEKNFYKYGGFLIFESYLNNLTLQISNPVLTCYEVVLTFLSLPNLPVCGFNKLLSFFPFVFVNFGNVANSSEKFSQTMSIGSLISNDPHAVNVNFLCPIANIKNPLIIQYVTIYSNQVVRMKLNFQEDLRLQVYLPNGKLLAYSEIYATNYKTQSIMKSNQCINLPLNLYGKYNVFSGIDNVYITAIFNVKPI